MAEIARLADVLARGITLWESVGNDAQIRQGREVLGARWQTALQYETEGNTQAARNALALLEPQIRHYTANAAAAKARQPSELYRGGVAPVTTATPGPFSWLTQMLTPGPPAPLIGALGMPGWFLPVAGGLVLLLLLRRA